jgi:hypothetical protein
VKPVRKLKICNTQKIKAIQQTLPEKRSRCSRLKLEEMLSNLGFMKEISWGEKVGQEIW